MTIIPAPTLDFSMLESTSAGNWNAGFGMNSYQVCTVTELPEGPSIDTDFLSGKKSYDTKNLSTSTAKDYPVLQFPPLTKQQDTSLPTTEVVKHVELDDGTLTLFADQPQASPSPVAAQVPMSDSVSAQKTTEDSESEEDRWARLENLCSNLDVTCEHFSAHISHIS